MTKRLSPERIAYQREHFRFHGFYDDPEEELLGHINAIEAELVEANKWCGHAQEEGDKTSIHWYEEFTRSQKELAEAKAEIARLKKKIEEWTEYADSKRTGRPTDEVPFG